jgi:hypothetical protein
MSSELKHEVGPLPTWAWGLIAGGALVVFEYWRRLNSSSASTPIATTADDDTPLDSSLNDLSASPTTSTTATGSSILSNSQWIAEAEAGLLNTGQDPLHILSALNDFIDGNDLSPAEQTVVNAALAQYGQPPEGLNAGLGTLETTPTTAATPVAQTSANNPVLAASRAAYDSTLAFLRSPAGTKLSAKDLAAERQELNQQGAVYQAQLKALNPS